MNIQSICNKPDRFLPSLQTAFHRRRDEKSTDKTPYETILREITGKTTRVFAYNQPCKPSVKRMFDSVSGYEFGDKENVQPKAKILKTVPSKPLKEIDAIGLISRQHFSPLDCSKDDRMAIILGSGLHQGGGIYSMKFTQDEANIMIESPIKLGNGASRSYGIQNPNIVKWIPETDYLAIGTLDGVTIIWDMVNNEHVRSIYPQNSQSAIRHMATINPDTLYQATADKNLYQIDLRENKTFVTPSYVASSSISCLSTNKSNNIAIGMENGSITILDPSLDTKSRIDLPRQRGPIGALDWMPSSPSFLASGINRENGQLNIWNLANSTNKLKCSIDNPAPITSLHWSDKASKIIALQEGNANCHGVFDYTCKGQLQYPDSLSVVQNLPPMDSASKYSALTSDGTTIITGTNLDTENARLVFRKCFYASPEEVHREPFSLTLGHKSIR
jgi:WD40 repeat protein